MQKDELHILFISGNCSTYFGWYFHPSSGAHTIVSTASGICHAVTAICRYRGRAGTGLSVLWVAYATHSILNMLHTLRFSLQNAVYFIMVCVLFTFYIQGVLKFKCKTPAPKG
jgi:hypothetical protein